MSKLYVANCTRQRHEFMYRAPEQKNPVVQVIEIGQQIMVWKDAAKEDLGLIVEQHQHYGLISVADIDRSKFFVGMCYQFDKPIDVNKIMYTVENNDTVLEERALEARKQAAQVISHSLNQVAQDAGNALGSVDVEIKELAQPGKEANFAETITVKNDHGQRGGGRRRGN
ncbi:hypothetical protein AB4Y43_01365 [Paraburkholderia sp. BR10872]|uniref:hypothetical protein n=1 Tax=Paraburkholderia sp. BR10872 TaxID=3236989 RepID=UPI0034D1D0C1